MALRAYDAAGNVLGHERAGQARRLSSGARAGWRRAARSRCSPPLAAPASRGRGPRTRCRARGPHRRGHQISFRGARAGSDRRGRRVPARAAAATADALRAHSDGQGASFVPSRAFRPGRARDRCASTRRRDYGFTIGRRPGAARDAPDASCRASATATSSASRSRPDLAPPRLTIDTRADGSRARADLPRAPRAGAARTGR